MSTTLQIGRGSAAPSQERLHHPNVLIRAAVRSARDGELFPRELDRGERAAFDERSSLERLDARARQGHEVGIAKGRDEASRSVDHRDGRAVPRLDPGAPLDHCCDRAERRTE